MNPLENTTCDLIIPVWNQRALTQRCVESVRKNTKAFYRLILIDNGSEEETRKYLANLAADPSGAVILIRNEKNLGYVKAINQALRISTAPFVALLNNDIMVTEGWLERIIEFAQSQPDAGLVNPLQNVVPGKLLPPDLEKFAQSQVSRHGEWMELDHCVGGCLLIKREVIEKIGDFNEEFGRGHWEDNDYSRRAQKAGYRCFRLLDTYVWHNVSASFKEVVDWKERARKNEQLYYQKWGKPLRIIYPVSEGIDFRRARFQQILQTVHALARQGCEVDLVIGKNQIDFAGEALPHYDLWEHENLRIHPLPLLRMEGNRGVRFSWNGAFHLACWLKIRRLLRQKAYDAIYLRHLNLANFFVRFRKFFPLPLVFEAHEIFYLTTERKNKVPKIQAQESRIYGQINGAVATTHRVAARLREVFPVPAPMAVIPNGVSIQFFHGRNEQPANNKILYVGQLYAWKGVGTLIEAMKYLSAGELHIIGGAEDQIKNLSQRAVQLGISGRVFFHGQVLPAQVRNHLADAAVAVHPLTQNTMDANFTSPLKLFEYMAAGVPIVASDLPSTREILTHEVNAILVPPDNPQALALGIQRLLTDREMADCLSHKAYEEALSYSWDRRAEKIVQFLRGLTGSQC